MNSWIITLLRFQMKHWVTPRLKRMFRLVKYFHWSTTPTTKERLASYMEHTGYDLSSNLKVSVPRNTIKYHQKFQQPRRRLEIPKKWFLKIVGGSNLFSSFVGHSCSDVMCLMLSLPVKFGGLGIPDLTKIAAFKYDNSKSITPQCTAKVFRQNNLQV